MREEVVKCDVCGRAKGPGNKWLRYSPPKDDDDPTFVVSIDSEMVFKFLDRKDTPIHKDACSESCLLNELTAYLATR